MPSSDILLKWSTAQCQGVIKGQGPAKGTVTGPNKPQSSKVNKKDISSRERTLNSHLFWYLSMMLNIMCLSMQIWDAEYSPDEKILSRILPPEPHYV